jgi:hypothetical protein
MPFPLIALVVVVGAGVVAATIAVAYWKKILNWALNSLVPWLDQNYPELVGPVKEVFVRIDKLAAPALAALKKTWQHIRQSLLQVVEEFEQLSNSNWLLRTTSWVRMKLDSLDPTPVVKRIQTEQVISYEELPPEIREQVLRRGESAFKVDVTKTRDNEMGLVMSA